MRIAAFICHKISIARREYYLRTALSSPYPIALYRMRFDLNRYALLQAITLMRAA